ncbi:hypothetical protein IWX78_001217 [Mycetocola sp. CAN_C7]|uniref:winged helix DNA-binding domain-containing protein n=1 Tax=Mycetocola sp. CAN_C7 TaxID=2787724 RepID=UPI0018CA9DAA
MAGQRSIDIARLRLLAQGVHRPEPRSPLETVRHLVAMQGQDLPGVLWSIGLRSPGITETGVKAAFDRGEIVRSWPMRGTLHVTTPADLRLILPLSRSRLATSLATRRSELGITEADVAVATEAALAALQVGPRVRKELFAVFESVGQTTSGQRGSHLIGAIAHAGLICLGPFSGREQAFVVLDQWAPPIGPPPDRDKAIADLALRYFVSHGPATEADFAWWANLTLRDVRAAIGRVDRHLARIPRNSTVYLADPALLGNSAAAPGPRDVHVLPGFDEHLLGYTDRSATLAAENSQAIVPGNNGVFRSSIVLGGRVAGTWSRRETASTIRIGVEPFWPLGTGHRAALERALDRYGRFRGKRILIDAPGTADGTGASATL